MAAVAPTAVDIFVPELLWAPCIQARFQNQEMDPKTMRTMKSQLYATETSRQLPHTAGDNSSKVKSDTAINE